MTWNGKRAKDRRIQRTEHLLQDALATLIREKPYDAIVVNEILERANVDRSTFYMHFRDKDEVLVSGIYDMLRSGRSVKRPPSASNDDRSRQLTATEINDHFRVFIQPAVAVGAQRGSESTFGTQTPTDHET